MAACRRRFGLSPTRPKDMPKPAPQWALDEWRKFIAWNEWVDGGRKQPRPKGIWPSAPKWASRLRGELKQKSGGHAPGTPLPPPPAPPARPVSHPVWYERRWVFVNTPTDIGPDTIAGLGYTAAIVPVHLPQFDSVLAPWVTGARAHGVLVAGWAWVDAANVELEGRQHAALVRKYAVQAFVANIEEPLDAHGDWTSPRVAQLGMYLAAFRAELPDIPLAAAVTPRWSGNHDALQKHRACLFPEAYPGEVPTATIPACVDHATRYGWNRRDVRPLIQVYPTNGVRPPAAQYVADARAYDVKVTPYPVESCLDDQAYLRLIAETVA